MSTPHANRALRAAALCAERPLVRHGFCVFALAARQVARGAKPKIDFVRDLQPIVVSPGKVASRRGRDTAWTRASPHPSLVNFDATNRPACTARRSRDRKQRGLRDLARRRRETRRHLRCDR